MNRLVNIAFQGGTHGNYLRYCIDKFSRSTPELVGTPFTINNTAHKRLNRSDLVVKYHPADSEPYFTNTNEPHILITIDEDDVLLLERWVTIRGHDFGIDTNKDSVKVTKEFLELFEWADKFKKFYNIDLYQEEIPRFILRDFYKLSFLDPWKNGFLIKDRAYRSNMPEGTFIFPVKKFWKKKDFTETLEQCNKSLNLNLDLSDVSIHDDFLKKLHHLKTRDRALKVTNAINSKLDIDISDLDTVEQGYVSAWIEANYDYIQVTSTNNFFKSTGEILEWIKYYPAHYKAMNPNLPTFNSKPNPFHVWGIKK